MKNLNDMLMSRRHILLLLGILTVVAITFAPVRQFDFVNWDDDFYVFENPLLTGSRPVPFTELLTTPYSGYMAPVMMLSYLLEHRLFGMDPAVFHTTNLLLHLICCLLVYAIGVALGLRKSSALLATLLFGLHPVVSESVSWITGRKDLLVTLFSLTTLLLLLKHASAITTRRLVLLLFFFLLAMLTKPIAVALIPIFTLILFRRYQERQITKSVAIRILLPLLLIALPIVLVGYVGQHQLGAIPKTASSGIWLRWIWYALGFHLGLLALLHPFCAKYVPEFRIPDFTPLVDLLPLAALVVAAFFYRLLKGSKLESVFVVGLTFAFFFYLPNSGIIPLSRFIADSFCYSLLPGLVWAFMACFERLSDNLPPLAASKIVPLALAIVLLFMAPLTRTEIAKWRNGVTLWQQAEIVNPASPQICRNLGNAHFQALQLSAAKQQYEKCAVMFNDTGYVQKNLAITLVGLKEYDEAKRLFKDLAKKEPQDAVVQKYLRHIEQMQSPRK